MKRKAAEILIRQYFQSWLEQDRSLLLSTLHKEVVIEECYGPVYCGIDEVRQWFVDWHTGSGRGKVIKWDILTILYDEMQEMAAVEWDFICDYEGNVGTFLGVSLFKFKEDLIVHIQEYQMDKNQHRPYQKQAE